jgi:hypothetical protein
MVLTGKFKGSCLWGRFSATMFRYCLVNDVAYCQGDLILGVRHASHAVAHWVEALRYKPEGWEFDSRLCH